MRLVVRLVSTDRLTEQQKEELKKEMDGVNDHAAKGLEAYNTARNIMVRLEELGIPRTPIESVKDLFWEEKRVKNSDPELLRDAVRKLSYFLVNVSKRFDIDISTVKRRKEGLKGDLLEVYDIAQRILIELTSTYLLEFSKSREALIDLRRRFRGLL